MVDDWLTRIQGMLLPPSCILCAGRGQGPVLDLCTGCDADLRLNAQACIRCAMPLPTFELAHALECGKCIRRPPPFDRAFVPFSYTYPLDRLIHRFKYQGALAFGRVLGTLLARELGSQRSPLRPLPQAIIPVPLHVARHRERGFNQALELARPVSRLLGVEIADRLCLRVRDTRDQTELSAGQRRKNMRKAFAVRRTAGLAHVALIDDVVTTGSTSAELARALKRAGVEIVEVWALARASHDAGGGVPRGTRGLNQIDS